MKVSVHVYYIFLSIKLKQMQGKENVSSLNAFDSLEIRDQVKYDLSYVYYFKCLQ